MQIYDHAVGRNIFIDAISNLRKCCATCAIGFRLFSCERIQLTSPFCWRSPRRWWCILAFGFTKYELIYAHEYYVFAERVNRENGKWRCCTDGVVRRMGATRRWKMVQIVLMSYFNWNAYFPEIRNLHREPNELQKTQNIRSVPPGVCN